MHTVIDQSELRDNSAAVMRRVGAGESFVVTVNGRPVADVTPHRRGSTRRSLVPVQELATVLSVLSSDDTRRWVVDVATADDVLDDEPTDPFDVPAR